MPIAAALLALLALPPDAELTRTRTITVGGVERTYLVHVPPSYDRRRAYPLVLAFHGGASNATVMRRMTGLDEKADEAGFVVAYPSGSGRLPRALTWDAGKCCGYASTNKVDDVAFTRALVDDLAEHVHLDLKRVYATGISNGGMMAYRLAAEASDTVAAVAVVSGSLEVDVPKVTRPVSVLHFHGTDDKYLPFQGGLGPRSLATGPHASVEQSVGAWVRLDECRPAPVTTELPVKVKDGTTVVRRAYEGCHEGAEVVLYEIRGGGHTWPGRPAAEALLGVTTLNVSANDVMWDFFARHALR